MARVNGLKRRIGNDTRRRHETASALLLWICGGFITGCAAEAVQKETQSSMQQVGGLEIYSEDGERQLVFITQQPGRQRVCFAPSPDAVFTGGGGAHLSVPAGAGSVSIGDQESIGSMTMGGRSPAVLITSELLYRACEFSNNFNLDKDEAKALYLLHLDVLKDLWSSQMGGANAAPQSSTTAGSGNNQ